MLNINNIHINAAILDMDGVLTQTAVVHSRAWKQMFDDFLKKRQGEDFQPLNPDHDYNEYIDGKPRLDGIRSFLNSRGIKIPEGDPDDDPEQDTVHGLGKRKNRIFLDRVQKDGVEVYPDAVEMLKAWKDQNVKLAVISSSRNCRHIIDKAGLIRMFSVVVDGVKLREENLRGKPEPDIFIQAAEELGVDIEKSMVIEDAISGVKAGKNGNFALVVGVDRSGKETALKEAGADIVIKKLTELKNIRNEEKENR